MIRFQTPIRVYYRRSYLYGRVGEVVVTLQCPCFITHSYDDQTWKEDNRVVINRCIDSVMLPACYPSWLHRLLVTARPRKLWDPVLHFLATSIE